MDTRDAERSDVECFRTVDSPEYRILRPSDSESELACIIIACNAAVIAGAPGAE